MSSLSGRVVVLRNAQCLIRDGQRACARCIARIVRHRIRHRAGSGSARSRCNCDPVGRASSGPRAAALRGYIHTAIPALDGDHADDGW